MRPMRLIERAGAWLVLSVFLALAVGCQRPVATSTGPMPQRGYLWQRHWNAAVVDAVGEADKHLEGLAVLAAQIQWNGQAAHVLRWDIAWDSLRRMRHPCALALRVDPFAGPFQSNDGAIRAIVSTERAVLEDARAHGVTVSEFQLDFDCSEMRLDGYRVWLREIRRVAKPVPLVVTALPAWLKMPGFRNLLAETDGYVLQVHSVPTQKETGRASLSDATLARKWVAQAGELGVPFTVSLPTYRCLAGYDNAGKLMGVTMDGVAQPWAPGTSVFEFATNASDVADLVAEWTRSRPATMRGLIWYRVPVATDERNWRWPTLGAVMAGGIRCPISAPSRAARTRSTSRSRTTARPTNRSIALSRRVGRERRSRHPTRCRAGPQTRSKIEWFSNSARGIVRICRPGAHGPSGGFVMTKSRGLNCGLWSTATRLGRRLVPVLALVSICGLRGEPRPGFFGPREFLESEGSRLLDAPPEFYWDLEVKRMAGEFHPTEKLNLVSPRYKPAISDTRDGAAATTGTAEPAVKNQ